MTFDQCATWDPDGRMILLAFSESSTLGSVHFASKPPSLGIRPFLQRSYVHWFIVFVSCYINTGNMVTYVIEI